MERVVPDIERVAKCRSFWKSRFGKPPSLVEITRVTGLSLERVRAALEGVAPERERARL
jgi:hypothetical protein